VKDTNVNLRLDHDTRMRLDAAAGNVGLNASALLRVLLERFLDHCARQGGRIVMPPEFREYEIRELNGDTPERALMKVAEGRESYGARNTGKR